VNVDSASRQPAPDLAPAVAPPRRPLRWIDAVPPRVLAALLLAALVSVFVLAVSEVSVARLNHARDEATRLRGVASAVGSVRASVARAESAQRGYLLTSDTRYLQPFKEAVQATQQGFVDVSRLTSGVAEPSIQAQSMVRLGSQKLDEMRLIVTYQEQGRREQAMTLLGSGIGLQIMEDLVKLADRMEADHLRQLTATQAQIDAVLVQQRIGVGVVVLINLLFLAALGRTMVRQFAQRETHRTELMAQTNRLEQQVAERTTELSSLSAYLQADSEREKGQLARDLHDELGGILTAAKIDVAWLEGHAKSGDPDAGMRLRRLSGALDEAVDVKRRVIENLRPSLLDHLGLAAALEWHVRDVCGKAGLSCRFDLEQQAAAEPEIAIALFRIVQEALNNAVKHARASAIDVGLSADEQGWTLRLVDNGVGIANFEADHMSHGLAGMRQRALTLGGTLQIETRPGAGTTIEARIPLRAPPALAEPWRRAAG
jgi:signal transduction histidine kinase